MSKCYRDAIELGKISAGSRWRDRFAKFGRHGRMEELLCRLCGTTIARLLRIGDQNVSRIKNQTIIQELMEFAYLPNYREVLLEMSDGGKHVANACQECARNLGTSSLQALYSMDLSQWSSEGHILGDRTCTRHPTKILKVADVIKE